MADQALCPHGVQRQGDSECLLFIVFTVPEREFQGYEKIFQQMLYSVRLKQ